MDDSEDPAWAQIDRRLLADQRLLALKQIRELLSIDIGQAMDVVEQRSWSRSRTR